MSSLFIYITQVSTNTQRSSLFDVIGKGGLHCEYWQFCNYFSSVVHSTYFS